MNESLGRVSFEYQRAVREGRPPTQAVVDALGLTRSTAGRWIAQARREGFLEPATPGRASGTTTIHRPGAAVLKGLRGAGPEWTVCRVCLELWPCEEEQALTNGNAVAEP